MIWRRDEHGIHFFVLKKAAHVARAAHLSVASLVGGRLRFFETGLVDLAKVGDLCIRNPSHLLGEQMGPPSAKADDADAYCVRWRCICGTMSKGCHTCGAQKVASTG